MFPRTGENRIEPVSPRHRITWNPAAPEGTFRAPPEGHTNPAAERGPGWGWARPWAYVRRVYAPLQPSNGRKVTPVTPNKRPRVTVCGRCSGAVTLEIATPTTQVDAYRSPWPSRAGPCPVAARAARQGAQRGHEPGPASMQPPRVER